MTRSSTHTSPIKANLAAALFGGILPLSLAPWDWWPMGIISITGLILLLKNIPASSCFWRSFWYGMGLFGSGASWVFVSIHEHGNAATPLAATLTLLFITAPALSFALPMTLNSFFNRHPVATIMAFPSLWVLAEWFRGWVLTGFPWLYLGYGYIDTALAGWAPIAGVLSISWIAAFCAAMLALTTERKKYRRAVENGLLIVAVFWVAGWYFGTQSWTTRFTSDYKIGVIQPSLPIATKWDPSKLDEILDIYRDQTDLLYEHDIIVWPESAIPRLQHDVKDFLQEVNAKATKSRTAIITGIPTQDFRTKQYFNSVIGLGAAEGTYHKQHLVPFGEYVPLEHLLRGSIEFFDLPMSQFSAGPDNQPLLTAKGLKIGTYICYEIVFPTLVSKSAADANLLVTVSNDSWFGDSLGPKQHLEMARMRALENGKPLIRATNDGISALIDDRGNIVATVPPFFRTVLSGKLTPRQGSTPFNQWGHWSILLFSLAALLVALISRSKKPKRRSTYRQ